MNRTWLMALLLWPLMAVAQSALERYNAEDYGAAARLGLRELADAPRGEKTDELRMAVANSLAWTGDYDPALEQYRALFGTRYDTDARVGLANVLRWRGEADLAEPYYREVLGRDPDNAEAKLGREMGGRDLRPAVTGRGSRTADNQGMSVNEFGVSYRRWTEDLKARWDVGALTGQMDSPQGNFSPQGVQGSLWLPQAPMAPKLEAFAYDNGAVGTRLFGAAEIQPVRDKLRLRVARVDWGRQAFSGAATRDGLTAAMLGISGETGTPLGQVRGRLDAYDVSDDNRVLAGEAAITPAWQPFPWQLKWSSGVTARRAEREDARYWSPHPAYGVAFIGLQRGWYLDRLDLTASVRRSFAFTDTAGDGWTVALSGRYWIAKALAIGLEAWAVDAPRPTPYTMHQVGAFLQQLW
jgi:tetratricopeptide (TPR) repeat protein